MTVRAGCSRDRCERLVSLALFCLRGSLVSSLALLALFAAPLAAADPLTVYFIDVEGGGAMLVVSPDGRSMLVDSGYPDLADRDLKRLKRVINDVAGLDHLDVAVVTHWHRDHYGNHAALAAEVPIRAFYDRGIPDALQEDKEFETRIAAYRAATQNDSQTLRAGDSFLLSDDDAEQPVRVEVVAASRGVVEGGAANPFADDFEPRDRDTSDNAESLAMVIRCGEFDLFCGGDLTWNVEADLATPSNPVGEVDLYMVTHHGLPTSNNPVLVKSLRPTVAVMCNGPSKGGHPDVLALLAELQAEHGLQAWFQLHRNLSVDASEQAPASRIANVSDTASCDGRFVSVVFDGETSFSVGTEGEPREAFAVK